MLSLLTSKRALTLKERVEKFWAWYGEVASRFHREINEKRAAKLQPEVSSKIDDLFPGFAWEFGPGEQKGWHAFTLSGEGDLHRQLIARYWRNRAPEIPGWSFYSSRQPCDIAHHVIEIGEHRFDPSEFWLTPTVDAEREKIDVVFWHPLFAVLPEKQRWTVTFLFLDQTLGELATGRWIGEITLSDSALSDAVPLRELPGIVTEITNRNGWKHYPPGESFTGYGFKEPHDDFPRGDVVAGSTSNVKLLNEYLHSRGDLADPLVAWGADYVYVAFDSRILPKGNESHARGEIEDALESELARSAGGYVLGGAYGTRNSYIDMILFNGAKSLQGVEQVLRQKNLPPGTSINFFAKEKRAKKIVLD